MAIRKARTYRKNMKTNIFGEIVQGPIKELESAGLEPIQGRRGAKEAWAIGRREYVTPITPKERRISNTGARGKYRRSGYDRRKNRTNPHVFRV